MNPATDRMLIRIKDVYLFIRDNGKVTTEAVADEFNISPRTAQRDLNVLEYNELIKSSVRGEWTTTSKKVKLSS
ncbi:alkaline phosphatase [Sporosarcina sp. P21c]|uniref:DeoR family transcriptional regulator n=1 Tax=Sporosarcina TaxID=1569 RepID=UPI000A158E15|nr:MULTISPECIES: DeoR family transcriptional regulator [Sporosarcina]ARJ38056.1 alkaline phosphatase [Sporosarcina ureae]PIC66723.1 alkaline phosphatase [Sporosarcina sp. P16a]PIC83477.1 alkaline phosphatase [Sporosarcina sp. P1]PIC89858.1 alkaline phosphatase [Sporosarcina sp. P21c]PIC93244.1 alkaline phosphatase [Sporosarcina sp. P25]